MKSKSEWSYREVPSSDGYIVKFSCGKLQMLYREVYMMTIQNYTLTSHSTIIAKWSSQYYLNYVVKSQIFKECSMSQCLVVLWSSRHMDLNEFQTVKTEKKLDLKTQKSDYVHLLFVQYVHGKPTRNL